MSAEDGGMFCGPACRVRDGLRVGRDGASRYNAGDFGHRPRSSVGVFCSGLGGLCGFAEIQVERRRSRVVSVATNAAGGSREALAKFVASLHRDYEVWYAKSVRRVYLCYAILQMTALLSGFATSVVAAVVNEHKFGTWGRWVLIATPALGSLAVACLLQFRVYELWRLREQGRIAFQDLALTGQRRLAFPMTEEECAKLYEELQQKTTEIEKAQSDSFFGLYRADFVSQFQHTSTADHA